MQRTIWEWIVGADNSVGDVAFDAGIAVVLASIATEVLRLLITVL